MFGKYFKHVLILTLLAGMAYSLPQVKDSMVGAFSIPGINEALAIRPISSSSANYSSRNIEMQNQMVNRVQEVRKLSPKEVISPEEVIMVLFKEGIISKDKLAVSIKIIKNLEIRRNQGNLQNLINSRPNDRINASSTYILSTSTSQKAIELN
jgi:hypothetical protein